MARADPRSTTVRGCRSDFCRRHASQLSTVGIAAATLYPAAVSAAHGCPFLHSQKLITFSDGIATSFFAVSEATIFYLKFVSRRSLKYDRMKSKAIFTAAVLFCLGIALTVSFAATGHAAASSHPTDGGGGGFGGKYPWDTDNLKYRSYTAASFNIPFHKYRYSGAEACQSNVADGFFQTDNAVVNDFPSLSPTGTGGDLRWVLAAGSAGNDAGCDVFVSQQDRLAGQVASGTGYALNSEGKLTAFNPGADVHTALTTGRSSSDIAYLNWRGKDLRGNTYTVVDLRGATTDPGYLRRVDGQRNAPRAIHPSTEQWTVPERTSGGNFGARWHGRRGNDPASDIRVAYALSWRI